MIELVTLYSQGHKYFDKVTLLKFHMELYLKSRRNINGLYLLRGSIVLDATLVLSIGPNLILLVCGIRYKSLTFVNTMYIGSTL